MLQKIKQVSLYHKKVFFTSLVAGAHSFQVKPISFISQKKYDDLYDLAVIGGGSGGLSTAFEASQHGLRTIVIDYVEQSPPPHRTKWGLGGTCVNVGCIPKKLMHQAAIHGENIINSLDYGWELPDSLNERTNEDQLKKYFSWQRLRKNVMAHIKSLNFGYLSNINKQEQIDYLNAMATFLNKETLLCSKDPFLIRKFIQTQKIPEQGEYFLVNAKNFVVATGTRPQYLQIKGSELAITSDDIFYKKKPPGKTLVVGGGYVAVEIAGFLSGLGYNVSMMTRQIYLRSFDRDMVNQIVENLKKHKINIIPTSLPESLQPTNDEKVKVNIQNTVSKQITSDTFDTVIFATGRSATTQLLNLDKIGVQTAKNKKVKTLKSEIEQTSVQNIYAIGDVVEGLPQLTSTAIKMGQNLGRRIANRVKGIKFANNKMFTDLTNYPTTVFTPLEYSCCGMSEQKAIETFGESDIEVYRIKYYALEEQLLDKYDQQGNSQKTLTFSKAIVRKSNDRVLGLHYAGPNAGQVMQGFAAAIKMGLTKQILDETIGIHPTSAEKLTEIKVTKASGLPFEKTSC